MNLDALNCNSDSCEMSFGETEKAAEKWLSENPQVKLIFSDANEKRLYFMVQVAEKESGQFSIELPTSATSNWAVRSDCDDQKFLAAAKELCTKSKDIKIEDILSRISTRVHSEMSVDDNEDCGDDEDEGVTYDDFSDDDFCDGTEAEAKAKEALKNEEEFSRYANQGNPSATKRLLKDMQALQASKGEFGISGSPRDDNLYLWDVKLTNFDPKSHLAKDLDAYAKKYNREAAILLEMSFQDTYPMTPPFVRVLRPRFKFLTGHITIGGSICMQMLTRSGWSPGNDIESILVQIRSEIMSDPDARLELSSDQEYTEHEAKDAFMRMVQRYKWN